MTVRPVLDIRAALECHRNVCEFTSKPLDPPVLEAILDAGYLWPRTTARSRNCSWSAHPDDLAALASVGTDRAGHKVVAKGAEVVALIGKDTSASPWRQRLCFQLGQAAMACR